MRVKTAYGFNDAFDGHIDLFFAGFNNNVGFLIVGVFVMNIFFEFVFEVIVAAD